MKTTTKDDRKFTVQVVWDAYQALHRYVAGGLPIVVGSLPKKLNKNPWRRDEGDCEKLADQLERLYVGSPLMADPLHFAYVFLFVQLLRCSYTYGPTFVDQHVGWQNLGWFPIRSLRGLPGKSERAWFAWLNRTVCRDGRRRISHDDLESVFPFFPSTKAASLVAVKNQLHLLTHFLGKNNFNVCIDPARVARILEESSSHGGPRLPGQDLLWHPMFIISRPESWVPDGTRGHLVEREYLFLGPWVTSIIDEPANWKALIEEFLPAANLDFWSDKNARQQALEDIRDGFEDFVKHRMPSRRYRDWKRMRRRCFPRPDGDDED